jgi:aconitase A
MFPVGLQPTEAPASLDLSTVSESVPDPTKPANVEPLSKQERRRRLIELAKQTTPPENKFLNPFAKYSIAAPDTPGKLIDTS